MGDWFLLNNQNWILPTCDSFPLIVSHLCLLTGRIQCKCAFKEPFKNTCKGTWCKKKKYPKKFSEHPFRPQKISGPFFAMKIMGQPHKKACKLNFNWDFFSRLLTRSTNFKAPLFASGPLNKCLWNSNGSQLAKMRK